MHPVLGSREWAFLNDYAESHFLGSTNHVAKKPIGDEKEKKEVECEIRVFVYVDVCDRESECI